MQITNENLIEAFQCTDDDDMPVPLYNSMAIWLQNDGDSDEVSLIFHIFNGSYEAYHDFQKDGMEWTTPDDDWGFGEVRYAGNVLTENFEKTSKAVAEFAQYYLFPLVKMFKADDNSWCCFWLGFNEMEPTDENWSDLENIAMDDFVNTVNRIYAVPAIREHFGDIEPLENLVLNLLDDNTMIELKFNAGIDGDPNTDEQVEVEFDMEEHYDRMVWMGTRIYWPLQLMGEEYGQIDEDMIDLDTCAAAIKRFIPEDRQWLFLESPGFFLKHVFWQRIAVRLSQPDTFDEKVPVKDTFIALETDYTLNESSNCLIRQNIQQHLNQTLDEYMRTMGYLGA